MQKIVFGLLILTILLTLFGCTDKFVEPSDPAGLRSCSVTSDCISVAPKSCCACYNAINKNFADYWETRAHDSCEDIQCNTCIMYENPVASCDSNFCHIIEGSKPS